jgi:metal-responsive CopG/Arc/MetJ family transcriptional regulator
MVRRKKSAEEEDKIMRTMIYLDAETHNELRHLSVDEKISMSEIIRRALDEYLKKHKK